MDDERGKAETRGPRFARAYSATAVFLLSMVLFIVLVNVLVWAAASIYAHATGTSGDPVTGKYGAWRMRQAYSDMTDDQWQQLMNETWRRAHVFDQFVGFKEAPFRGKYVNVADNGYRLSQPQGPWPIDPKNYNVFVFGGSTTFGYGVTDDQTIPARMQAIMMEHSLARRVCVYNFGRGFYYSTPERILFEQLLLGGARPNLAVFFDGVNDFGAADDRFTYSRAFARAMESSRRGLAGDAAQLVRSSPVAQAAWQLIRAVVTPPAAPAGSDSLGGVIRRYVWNKDTITRIADVNGVATIMVIQPVPMFEYDTKYHLFDPTDWRLKNAVDGYPLLAQYVKEQPMGDNFLWIAGMQKDIQKHLYVDQLHYNREFSDMIAHEIVNFVEKRGLLPRSR